MLALLASALVLRIGGACEAMAATATAPAFLKDHCAEIPAKSGKPAKSDAAACATCVALPCGIPGRVRAMAPNAMEPVASLASELAGLARGPAPPPPRIA